MNPSNTQTFQLSDIVGKDGVKFSIGFDMESMAYLAGAVFIAVLAGVVAAKAITRNW